MTYSGSFRTCARDASPGRLVSLARGVQWNWTRRGSVVEQAGSQSFTVRAEKLRQPRRVIGLHPHILRPGARLFAARMTQTSKLRIEQRDSAFQHLFDWRTALPVVERETFRVDDVVVENRRLLAREIAVVDVQVRFVVELERAVVEVGRADRRPDTRPPPAPCSETSSAGTRTSRRPLASRSPQQRARRVAHGMRCRCACRA